MVEERAVETGSRGKNERKEKESPRLGMIDDLKEGSYERYEEESRG